VVLLVKQENQEKTVGMVGQESQVYKVLRVFKECPAKMEKLDVLVNLVLKDYLAQEDQEEPQVRVVLLDLQDQKVSEDIKVIKVMLVSTAKEELLVRRANKVRWVILVSLVNVAFLVSVDQPEALVKLVGVGLVVRLVLWVQLV